MLKLFGVILLIGGATGFACCLCGEQKKRLSLLKEIRYMYRLMQEEIQYTGLPLPEIFKNLAKSLAEPISSALQTVGESMTLSQRESFEEIWQCQMQKSLKGSLLKNNQKELVLKLPETLNLSMDSGQVKVLQRQIEELDRWIIQMEEEEKNKNKVIMSLGIAAGVFLAILLF